MSIFWDSETHLKLSFLSEKTKHFNRTMRNMREIKLFSRISFFSLILLYLVEEQLCLSHHLLKQYEAGNLEITRN